MTETTTPAEEQASSSVQPGDLTTKLQVCRERAGLDIEQAADEMHLSVSLLRALEKEDFAHLPEPPYVRGYLRGYAKLADQDAKELIRTYEALRGADPDEIAHHFAPARPLGKVTQPAISPATVKFIGLAVVVLGLGLLSMIPGVRGWFSDTWSKFSAQTAPPQVVRPAPALETFTAQKDAEEASKQQPAESTGDVAATTPADTSAKPAGTDAGTAPATTSEEQATTQSATGTSDDAAATATTSTTAEQAGAPAADTQAITEPSATTSETPAAASPNTAKTSAPAAGTATQAPATDTATTVNGNAPATQTDPNAVTADGNTTATPPQPIAGEVNVKLEFAEEVWMQVKDDGKKTLFESLNSAGSTKEFKATTPLNFKIGNARGVKIYLNGQEFNQAPHTKGSVARFKVE